MNFFYINYALLYYKKIREIIKIIIIKMNVKSSFQKKTIIIIQIIIIIIIITADMNYLIPDKYINVSNLYKQNNQNQNNQKNITIN